MGADAVLRGGRAVLRCRVDRRDPLQAPRAAQRCHHFLHQSAAAAVVAQIGWVPTLYFAEGVPFFAVALIAGILYKRLGLRNDVITFYTSLLLLPWSLKPLWSPLIEMFKTKKFFVVALELAGGLSLALVALCLPLPGYFGYTLALLAVVAFSSSTHDIAADGLYIASLSPKEQAAYTGWQGGFYNAARFFSQGGLIILAGYLELRVGVPRAWMAVFVAMGLILMALSIYHAQVLP